jgi:hypothetical protein
MKVGDIIKHDKVKTWFVFIPKCCRIYKIKRPVLTTKMRNNIKKAGMIPYRTITVDGELHEMSYYINADSFLKCQKKVYQTYNIKISKFTILEKK